MDYRLNSFSIYQNLQAIAKKFEVISSFERKFGSYCYFYKTKDSQTPV
jgi:hypothetical protein